MFVLIWTQSLVNFANSSESNQWEHNSFIKFPSENATYEFEQIINDDNQSITIVPSRKGFQPLGLFHDIHFEEYNFSTSSFDRAKPSLTCSYQKII